MRALVAVAAAVAAPVVAQQVRAVAPIGAIAPPAAGPAGDAEDPGVPVEMFENPNLDRYLHKARGFLDSENYAAAIEVLQDVIEGRTAEVVAAAPEESPAPEPTADAPRSGGGAPAQGKPAAPAPVATKAPPLDARNSVFSHDGRLYRPVRRLCHELLAHMPPIGVEIYRTTHEATAAELLDAALRSGSTAALEDVANRYFVTLPAGRALALLADRLMHEGRYRAAVQVLRDLLETYPASNRQRLGITDPWCAFKIALCLRLAGEADAAHAAAAALAASHADESLRIEGELQSVADLPVSDLFSVRVEQAPAAVAAQSSSWLGDHTQTLVPMWQYRFRNPEPYREPKASRDRTNVTIFGAQGSANIVMPYAGRHSPATHVAFERGAHGGTAWFLEHFCLREADAASGVQLAQSDGPDEPPQARDNQPRVRVAASDYALLRPIHDGERTYVVIGPARPSGSADSLRASELVALHRNGLQRVWSSQQWLDGDGGLRDVTFLAAPTVFGERLLLPALRRNDFTLECVDRSSGRPLWHVRLHRGGTPYYRAPGTPVLVHGSTALVATNAGCLAAVDAFAGDLRWIRRYERVDPARKAARSRRSASNQEMHYGQQFLQQDLATFHPNDLVIVRDGVVVAPCDAELVSCIDVASGEPRWFVDATSRHTPWSHAKSSLRTLIGAAGDDLFFLADNHVVAIDGAGGLVRWAYELPPLSLSTQTGRGRGAIVGEHVVVPGARELFVLQRDGKHARRLPLPAFDASREPVPGPFHVATDGPWIAIGYQGGVEVFSTAEALLLLAQAEDDLVRKCSYLVQAGDLDGAIHTAVEALERGVADTQGRAALAKETLSLVRERAARLAGSGDVPGAMAELDAIGDLMTDRAVRLDWHLARVELCKAGGDLRAHEQEQLRLYAYMEGKG